MPDKKPVYLMSYDHGGYIFWAAHFVERIESAISWMDKYPSFKIGLDNESFAYDQFAEEAPEIIESIKQALAKYKGRFGIGASTYGQPLSVFVNEESNVRQLVYAIRTNVKYFGITPPVYAISEHALHSQIPQLIKQAGFHGAVMRTHFMMYGYNPTFDAPIGFWVGEDGTRIPTIPTYHGQGAAFGITTMDNWVLTRWPDQTDLSLERFVDRFGHIEPLLASRYDDVVLRCEKLVEHVEGNPNYQWVLLEDLLAAYPAPQEDFCPKANDFIVRMPWGYCGNRIWNACRKAEVAVLLAERLSAAAYLAGGNHMEAELEQAWKGLLISQHHDIQICGLISEADGYTSDSIALSKRVTEKSLQYICSLFHTIEKNNIVVFNPLSWHSRQWVQAEIALPRKNGAYGFMAVCGDERLICSADCLEERHGKMTRAVVRFEASVNALTAKCYSIEPIYERMEQKQAVCFDEEQGRLSTDFYDILLDEYGICSIYHKRSGIYFVQQEKGCLFRGMIDDQDCAAMGRWHVYCRGGEAIATHYGEIGGILYTFVMTIRKGSERIDCRVKFTHHGEVIGSAREFDRFEDNTNGFIHEDKLRFILHTKIEQGKGVRDLPFTVSETDDKDIQGNYWTAVTDGEKGIAYFNRGAMCAVREGTGFSLPLAYANEYVWGARYLYGEHEHEFAILPFVGDYQAADVHRKAYEYVYPFQALHFEENPAGKERDEIQFMHINADDTIILSALYPEKNKVIARFYEYMGGEGEISLTSEFAQAESIVNIMGDETGEKMEQPITIGRHQIKSVALKRKY